MLAVLNAATFDPGFALICGEPIIIFIAKILDLALLLTQSDIILCTA